MANDDLVSFAEIEILPLIITNTALSCANIYVKQVMNMQISFVIWKNVW